jgi:carboxylesterase
MTDVLPGAEPWTYAGGPVGVLCLHGFTGHPGSMRPVAEALAAAGFSIELPLLPGHGTTVDDMLDTGWQDWATAAEDALQRLVERCDKVVAAGQSMGGSLALWLATMYVNLAGVVVVNPATQPQPDDVLQMVTGMLHEGTEVAPGGPSDLADPSAADTAYSGTPLRPLMSFQRGLRELQYRYGQITCPTLEDHVVDPAQSDYLAEHLGGPVERVFLERSYHVATLDYDGALVRDHAVDFVRRVTAP